MLKVFLADDSPIIRQRLISLIAELAGLDIVGIAQTGAEAIDGAETLKPDVLILDIHMPESSGFDVLKQIKQRPDAPVIIILTNHPEYQQGCLNAGADYFLDKSVEFNQIAGLLEQLNQKRDSDPHSPTPRS